MAIFASFLYAFPIAPLLGSNWTTFTVLCGEVREKHGRLALKHVEKCLCDVAAAF